MFAAIKPEAEAKLTLSTGEMLADELTGIKFQIDELIGRGGMGEVYRARRLSDGASFAVKCVRHDLVQNQTILLRTRFEAQAFRKISHPNVVQVHGTGVRSDNVPWMAMEWLSGFTVAEILERKGRIPLRWAVEIVRDLCLGLQAIHEYAIHRDIKPSNVHLGFDTVTRALDLGAAKPKEANVHLTSTGYQVGTLPFMAPEQLDNTMQIDHRADLWAAAVLLYILLTGVHPFAQDGALPASKIKLGWSILSDPHRPLLSLLPSAPSFFEEIIDRGLAKDPAQRYQSAEELATVLTAVLGYLEAKTGHAEPLSSLLDDLRGNAAKGAANADPRPTQKGVAEPPPVRQTAPESPLLSAYATTEVSMVGSSDPRELLTSVPPSPSSPASLASEEDPPRALEDEPEDKPEDKPPRWLYMMMIMSAVACMVELVYYLGPWREASPWRSADPPSGPIAVPFVLPVVPSSEPEPEPEPAPALTASRATAAPATAAAPASPPRPTAEPRPRRSTLPAPTSTAKRRLPTIIF